jgi:hypothetical protein
MMSIGSTVSLELRVRCKKERRKSVVEITCNCGAYSFPHRFGGGKRNGRSLAYQWWANRDCGECRNITYDSEIFAPYCQVVDGGESLEECGRLQEFLQRNEVHIKGVKWN